MQRFVSILFCAAIVAFQPGTLFATSVPEGRDTRSGERIRRGSWPFCYVTLRGRRPLPAVYPKQLRTLRDHLRKRRLDLELLQRQVAEQICVDKSTVPTKNLVRPLDSDI